MKEAKEERWRSDTCIRLGSSPSTHLICSGYIRPFVKKKCGHHLVTILGSIVKGGLSNLDTTLKKQKKKMSVQAKE